jgi:hypothetical protein
MKFRIVNNAWWMFWARGMVLWPWMWLRPIKVDPRYDEEIFAEWYQLRADRLYRHELEHCYQVKRMGRLRFYSTYLWHWVTKGYKKHPYEIEAEEHEEEQLTEQELRWRERGVIEL